MENITVGEMITIALSLSAFLAAVANIRAKSKSAIEKTVTAIVDPMIKNTTKKIDTEHMGKLDEVVKKLDHIIERQRLQETTSMAITAGMIHDAYLKYSRLGKIDTYTYNVLSKLYTVYEKNGGNGLVRHQMEVLTEIYEEGGAEL